jgi:hypothetical protein
VLEDAERLIGAWNERQAKRMRSAARSQRITGFSGFAVRPAGRRAERTAAADQHCGRDADRAYAAGARRLGWPH